MNSFSFGSANSSTLALAPNLASSEAGAHGEAAEALPEALVAPGVGVDRLELGRVLAVRFHALNLARGSLPAPKGIARSAPKNVQ